MKLVIRQKYFAIGNKFAITNENDVPVFYAREQIMRLRANMDIMNLNEVLLAHMEAKFAHIFSYFEISNAAGDVLGNIDERMHMPFFRRAVMTFMGKKYKIKAGPVHMKVIARGEDDKWDRKNPVCRSTKRLMRIADTYTLEVDQRRIDPVIGAMIALWYDKIKHNRSH